MVLGMYYRKASLMTYRDIVSATVTNSAALK
jgi:hypothetical protein